MTFNYRVGILGHLHSRKLAEEATLQMDVPPCFRSTANLGLIDSHMAFDWVGQVQNPFSVANPTVMEADSLLTRSIRSRSIFIISGAIKTTSPELENRLEQVCK